MPEPPPGEPKRLLSALDALRADPTVVVGPIPKEEQPQPATPASLKKPAIPSEDAPSPVAKPRRVAEATPGGHVYVQAGAYLSEARARQAAAGLETMDVKIMNATVNGREVFRVRIGPFTTMAQARAAFAEAQGRGHNDLIIVRE